MIRFLTLLLFVIFIPYVAGPGILDGPGVAGYGTVADMHDMGVTWYYNWCDCAGRDRCLPMLRVGYPLWPEQSVASLMATCGTKPCPGLMILNEPSLWPGQDVCDANCQAQQLHDHAPEAIAINPNAVVIFGNYAQRDTAILNALDEAWSVLYPDLNLSTFMRRNHVRVGIHKYVGPGYYSVQGWRDDLLAYQAAVRERWNVPIVLTEYGSLNLSDGWLWKQVVSDQAPWLASRRIPAAPFLGGQNAIYCCSMTVTGGGLTEYGELYAQINSQP